LLIQKRQEVAKLYDELLSNLPIICPKPIDGSTHIYQMYTVRFQDNSTRESARKKLTQERILSKIYFDPAHLTSFYSDLGFKKGDLPVTERIADTVLTLPIYPNMPPEDVELVCNIIKTVL